MDDRKLVSIFPETVWTPAGVLLFMAVMLLILLLALVSSLEGSQHEMLCSPAACFVLNMEPVNFPQAQNRCVHDGGYLVTIRDRDEEADLRSLLSLIENQHHEQLLKFWIGLKLNRGSCVLANRTLRGFRWVSGDADSHYSNWKHEPVPTCTEDRCAVVGYSVSGPHQLSWTPVGCRKRAFYVCKFLFRGMCKPLSLLGRGQVTYEAVFHKSPLKPDLKLIPYRTKAKVSCGGREVASSWCSLKDGVYGWDLPGPFCQPEPPNCERNNGGCEHQCRQEREAVRCSCREGFELDQDGSSCRKEDLCRHHICEHRCVMGETGFSCECPAGFRLSENQRNCSDIDECGSQACGGRGCVNTHGGYRCVCEQGYELSDGECAVNPPRGGGSHGEVNECAEDPCPSELTCIDTAGSFACQGTAASARPPEGAADGETPSLESRTTEELQQQSPHTDAPQTELVNVTHGDHNTNQSWVFGVDTSTTNRVMICVLGSVVPLLALIAVTLFIAIFRCSRSKKELKKKSTADGYCWVSSGLDPRLEKLYESILTDDL